MGEFIEVIMSNLFLVIIIITGIIGFFGNKEQEKKTQAKQQEKRVGQHPGEKPAQARRSESRTQMERPQKTVEESTIHRTSQKRAQDTTIYAHSIEDEQQAQIENLEEKYGGQTISDFDTSGIHPSLVDGMSLDKKDEFAEEKKELRNELKKSLRKKGLINGIIMSEVLGSPRAIKPYKKVIEDRGKIK